MTVIQLSNIGYPRSQETVTIPQHPAMLGESSTTRAGYDQWKQQHGIAGLSISPPISGTQIGIAIAGAILGYYAGKKLFKTNEYGYVMAIVVALATYWFSRKASEPNVPTFN